VDISVTSRQTDLERGLRGRDESCRGYHGPGHLALVGKPPKPVESSSVSICPLVRKLREKPHSLEGGPPGA
jgi:hypothetical protein